MIESIRLTAYVSRFCRATGSAIVKNIFSMFLWSMLFFSPFSILKYVAPSSCGFF